MMKLKEASKSLGVSERTLRRMIKRGNLTATKEPGPQGPEWVIPEEEVSRLAGVDVQGLSTLSPDKATLAGVDVQGLSTLVSTLATEVSTLKAVVTGQIVSELQTGQKETTASIDALRQELAEQREAHREEMEEAHRRNEELLEELRAIREALARPPWWARLWARVGRRK